MICVVGLNLLGIARGVGVAGGGVHLCGRCSWSWCGVAREAQQWLARWAQSPKDRGSKPHFVILLPWVFHECCFALLSDAFEVERIAYYAWA